MEKTGARRQQVGGGGHSFRPSFCLLSLLSCTLFLLTSCVAARFPGRVRPTVKVGLIAPFEGRYRYIGYDVVYAVRLALQEANVTGGVGGYSVELVAYDDGANSVAAVEQVRKLAIDPAAVAAIGHFREETTAAAADLYAEVGVPLVAPMCIQGIPDEEALVFHIGPEVEEVVGEWVHRLGDLGHVQAALVTEGGPLGMALQRDAQRYRLQVQPVVSPEASDWLEVVKASRVEVVLCDASPVTAGEVVSSLRTAGWRGVFVGGPELSASDFVAVAGVAAEGTEFVTPWPFPADVSGSSEFETAYLAVSNGISPGPLALPAYEAAWVLLEALERDIVARGVPTREGMAEAIAATGRDGLLGRITFDAGQNWKDVSLYWYRIGVDGKPEMLF